MGRGTAAGEPREDEDGAERQRAQMRGDESAEGLCLSCAHSSRIVSARGSEFWLCRLAAGNPAFTKYPRLPVLRCPGYERRSREA